MKWSLSFSFWVINGIYDSDYNSTLSTPPKVIEVDDCGPGNLLSAAYAFWLVLLPAVACVVHLPGSLFLFRRSNFYRFSPELGIVDALAVISLVVKALRKGYRWDESIAAVLTVRRGIGRGDLWWRKDLQTCSSLGAAGDQDAHEPLLLDIYEGDTTDSIERPNGTGAPGVTRSSEEDDHSEGNPSQSDDDQVRYFLTSKFAPILASPSQKRVLGAVLFLVSFVKVVAMQRVSANSGMRVTCYLALAYSASYLVLEILAWSCVFRLRNNSLSDPVTQNLLEIVRLVDPGDNRFAFMDDDTTDNYSKIIPLRNLVSASATSLSASMGRSFSNAWTKPVTIATRCMGLTGPLMWMLILSNVWAPFRCTLVLGAGLIAFIATRLAAKSLNKILRRATDKNPDYQPLSTESGRSDQETPAAADPFVQYNTHGIPAFFAIWFWRRVTTVNLYSAIWIVVICYYFVGIFPVRAGLFPEDPEVALPRKPSWLDWLR